MMIMISNYGDEHWWADGPWAACMFKYTWYQYCIDWEMLITVVMINTGDDDDDDGKYL